MSETNDSPELNAVGDQLRGLTPSACPINRDALMFRAGQASATANLPPVPWNWKWPLATMLSTCIAVTFGVALLVGPAIDPPLQKVTHYPYSGPPPIPSMDPPDASEGYGPPGMVGQAVSVPEEKTWPTPDTTYFQTENNLLRWGLDGVPMPAPAEATPPLEKKQSMLLRSF